ncbi:MAG: helix-turn-helix domain-containing protein, partial [Candidatus Cryptobacteroides sp.]
LTIETKCHELCEGSEAILFPGMNFFITDCSQDFRMKVFFCTESLFRTAHRKFNTDFFEYLKMYPIHRHADGTQENTLAYFSIIGDLSSDHGNRYRTMIVVNLLRSLLLNIYDKVQRYSNYSTETVFSRKEDIYKSFIELILNNFREHRDVGFYASGLCITPRYLASVTSAVQGKSPKQIIDNFILDEIKILLTFSDLTLQQIADRLHFPDSSYLGRFFRHYMKTSPSAWRAKEMSL